MQIVFAYSLYGDKPTYTYGMIANAKILKEKFPDARVQVYIADDVPAHIHAELAAQPNVRLVPVPRRDQTANTLDRFRAIDDDDCDIMFVRDADSRVHARDIACIEDFLASPSHIMHIIRDHKYHTEKIMACSWALRKLPVPLSPLIDVWIRTRPSVYMTDQWFLAQCVYPRYVSSAMIHDRYHRFEPAEKHTPFRVPIEGKLFVGQVHKISDTGEETLVYDP